MSDPIKSDSPDGAVDPAAFRSALPIVITTDGAVKMQIGMQQFTIQYAAEDEESLIWMADQLSSALKRAGARSQVSSFKKCKECSWANHCDLENECRSSVLSADVL